MSEVHNTTRTCIVEGPMACGKTFNAKRIAAALGCKSIVEGDEWRRSVQQWYGLARPVLVLTVNAAALPSFMREYASWYSFENVRRGLRDGGAA